MRVQAAHGLSGRLPAPSVSQGNGWSWKGPELREAPHARLIDLLPGLEFVALASIL